ncbi:hypothetical protein [Xanthomonas campestris]|uniref:hypothetical protein n=1 Tax=Xanthomonas campestris TaxID=339 RepID=UPI0005AEF272|nr:hypothetical protein [Xanthomonas campestris]KIQ21551.1 hypothetical protein RT95_20605 [Xanthomonas campestris]
MPNIKSLPTGSVIVALDTTPLLGGQGREGIANLGANASVTAGVLLQGHAMPADGSTPAAGSSGWFTLLSGVANQLPVIEIADLPDFIRTGAAATAPIILEGVQ